MALVQDAADGGAAQCPRHAVKPPDANLSHALSVARGPGEIAGVETAREYRGLAAARTSPNVY